MRTAAQSTSIDAYRAHRGTGQSAQQRNRILEFIKGHSHNGTDWSIGELAQALSLQKSTVSARINELLNDTKELVERPPVGQLGLFQ